MEIRFQKAGKMRTYIINLKRSVDRRIYMEGQCRKLPFLNVEYINAVDGRNMSPDERTAAFDEKEFEKRYSVKVRPGEIGCTLSHQKCYKKIVEEHLPCALILEDDISLSVDIKAALEKIGEMMQTDIPTVVLLSGGYWYGNITHLEGEYKLANVYDAFLTHSYVINLAAAKLLIETRPYITADDWYYIRHKGVKLQAVLPHLINQLWDGDLTTTVNVEPGRNKSLKWKLLNLPRLSTMKFLKFIGHFEEA